MQNGCNIFLLSHFRYLNVPVISASLLPITIGTIFLVGCTHHSASVIQKSAFSPIPQSITAWLPIYEKDHRIIAVGTYVMPKPIPVPSELTPVSPALAYFGTHSHHLNIVRIFFPASQELAVFKWSRLTPTVLAHPPGFHNYVQINRFDTLDSKTMRINRLSHRPSKPPYGWTVMWIGNNKDKNYNGFSSIYWEGDPVTSVRVSKQDAKDKLVPAEEYSSNSPVKDEPRHISLNLALWRDYLKLN